MISKSIFQMYSDYTLMLYLYVEAYMQPQGLHLKSNLGLSDMMLSEWMGVKASPSTCIRAVKECFYFLISAVLVVYIFYRIQWQNTNTNFWLNKVENNIFSKKKQIHFLEPITLLTYYFVMFYLVLIKRIILVLCLNLSVSWHLVRGCI